MPYYKNEKKHCPLWLVSHFLEELQKFTYNNWKGGGLRKKKKIHIYHINIRFAMCKKNMYIFAPIDLPRVSQTS
jgi:hypothetical protein